MAELAETLNSLAAQLGEKIDGLERQRAEQEVVFSNMTEGIIARFRTMAISRSGVLTGHVVGSVAQTMLGPTGVVGVALLIGFRPTAGLIQWIAAIGVLAMITFALTWLWSRSAWYPRVSRPRATSPCP